jgi:hypothetical protein
MMMEPPDWPEFDSWEEFGSIQIRADLFGLHIGENSSAEPEIWADAEEAEKLIRFTQFWLPKIQSARIPKCPHCYAKYEHTPDEDPHDCEMKPTRRGNATQWNCLYCGKSYNSGPFGNDLREIKPASNPGEGDDFDPFLEEDDLP